MDPISRISLLWKSQLVFVLVFASAMVAVALSSAWRVNKNLSIECEEQGEAIARSFASSSIDVLRRDVSKAQSIIDQYLELHDVAYVVVVSPKGDILVDTFANSVPAEVRDLKVDKRTMLVEHLSIAGVGDVINVSLPILEGEMGHVHVGMDRQRISAAIWTAIMQQMFLLGLILVLGIVVTTLLMKRIVQPLQNLTDFANRLATIGTSPSNYAEASAEMLAIAGRTDEVGRMAQAFRSMILTISAHEQELHNAHEELELRVQERTAALENANRALQAVEERLNLALKSSGVGTWSWNIVKNSIIWDDYIHPLFGLKPGTFSGHYEDFLQTLHPDDGERVAQEVAFAVEDDAAYDTEYQVVWPDGSVHVLGSRGKVYRDAAGRATRMTGVCWDITDRKRAQEAVAHQATQLARTNADLEQAQLRLAEIASHLALPAVDLKFQPYSLHEFSLTDLMHCGGAIRAMSRGRTRSDFAAALVRYLYDQMLGPDGHRALALVRLFEARRFDELDVELRDVAQAVSPDVAPATMCLTLAATAGDQVEWNDVKRSHGHRVIPLPSPAAAEQIPMIAQMIRQFGLDVAGVLNPNPEILLGESDVGVFYVPGARGSSYIPAQEQFVIPFGICSVVGFGGLLPNGRLFAVILFSKVPISHDVASLFGYLSLSMRMALLPYLDLPDKTSAQVLSLDRLMQNYEEIVAGQEQRLRATLAALVSSNKDLEQFAYVASHDLQEPLRAVTGYCQLLEHRYADRLDDEARGFIRHIVDGGERMQALIAGLLEYSRIGTRGKAPDAFAAGKAVESALTNLRTAIQESGATVNCGPLPSVTADEMQLTRLFQNLIGNALKYRGPSVPEIHISAENKGGEWLFCVRDNGIGFDPKHATRIFTIFQRLHTRREYPGTGIGLALCERIVQRHGGRIWAESAPGQGSSFYFTLPFDGVKRT